MPALVGCLAGVVVGNLLSVPLLSQTAQVYGVGALAVPFWVDLAVPLAMLALTGAAALPPAVRAARLSAVQAIATGRAPRPSGGYAAHRLLGRAPVARRLPRPVTLGLAGPFARPGRTLVTLAAIGFGVVAVTFAVGLGTSLDRVAADLSRAAAVPVQVELPGVQPPGSAPDGGVPSPAAQRRAVLAALNAQPGTARYVAEADDEVSVPGLAGQTRLVGFAGDASWTGYALITGHWYAGTGPGRGEHRLPHRDRHGGGRQLLADHRRQAPHGADRRRGLRPGRRHARRSSAACPPWPAWIRSWSRPSTTWR